MHNELQLLLRIGAAAIMTAMIGWERETAGKAAGLRTHVLVGVASCLFVTLGIAAIGDFPAQNVRIEPFSLIQAVAVGVGFLGSGIVRLGQGSNRPHGLTTAASIWAVAGIGLGAGFGKFILAGGTTVILLVVLRGVENLERRYEARKHAEVLTSKQ